VAAERVAVSGRQRSIAEILGIGPVVAVLTIERAADALPLAAALHAGGIRVLEVTLRSTAALDALEQIAERHADLVVGAGTVVHAEDFRAARDAGAQFAVSPGFTPTLHAAAVAAGIAWLPAITTPSEALAAQHVGYAHLKFFPAALAGGVEALRAFATVFPEVVFCPTGGITASTAPAYLATPNVACVGGTWVAPRAAIEAREWQTIQQLASEAARLPRARSGSGAAAAR